MGYNQNSILLYKFLFYGRELYFFILLSPRYRQTYLSVLATLDTTRRLLVFKFAYNLTRLFGTRTDTSQQKLLDLPLHMLAIYPGRTDRL